MFNPLSLFRSGGDPLALAKQQAAKAGMAPGALDEIAAEMKEIAASGKSQEEILTAMKQAFMKRGIPEQAVDMALSMMRNKLK